MKDVENFFHCSKQRGLEGKLMTRRLGKKQKRDCFQSNFYAALEVGRVVLFPKNIIWNPWVLSKVNFFSLCGKQVGGKVLTLDNLQKRGRSLVNRCFMCKQEGELIDHILLHYSKARILWHLLFSIFQYR